MSELIFSSEFFSLFGARYKVELTGENYTGLDTAIVTGSGNDWQVSKDWTDYLVGAQDVTLTDTGVGTQAAIVQSFSYDSGTDITTIELDFAFDSAFDRITSDSFFPVFSPEINKLDTDWEGEDDIFLKALKPSSTTIEYNNAPDTAFFDRFFELFLNSNDDELKVQVFKFDSGFKREWVGNLVHDLMEYDDTSASVPYTFKVIDGLDMLKDVPYDEALTGASEQPLISHIITLLSKINTSQFWGANDAYIRECIEYTSNEVPGLGIADSSLEYTFLDDRHFIDRKAQDTNEPLDSYDSLIAILELMSCRLFQAQGIWWIMQIRNFDNPTSIVFREFTSSIGAASSQSQFNHKITVGTSLREKDMVHMSNGVFAYEEGLLNTKLIVNKANEIYTDTDNTIITVNDTNPNIGRDYDLGRLYGGVGTGANIRVEFMVEELANSRVGYNLRCDLEIFVNDRFIKGGDSIDPFWGDDVSTTDRFWLKRVHQVGAGNKTKVIFETPEIPFSQDGVTLRLTFRYRGNFAASSGEQFFRIFNPKIFFPNAENPEEIVVGNPNTQFTKELDLGELIIDDLNRFTSIAILMVDDEFTTANPRNLIEAETWDADFATDDSLAVTRATEAISLQFKPIEKIQRKIEGTYYGFNSLSYNDKIYAFSGFRFNYLLDEYEGTWFEIATARESIVIDQVIKKFPEGTDVPHAGGEPKGWANNTRNNTIVLTTTTPTPAGAITSINILQPGHERIRNGDTIQVIHPITNSVFATFVVTADVNAGATTISVTSESIEFDITEEMIIIFKKGEVVEANIVRADTFIDKSTGGILKPVAGSDTEIQFNDNGLPGASSALTWDDTLKELAIAGDILLGDNDRINFGTSLNSFIHFDGSESVWVATTDNIRLNSEGVTEAIQFKVGTQTTATSVLFMDSTNAQLTRFFGDGTIRNFKYGLGNITGTATKIAAWDANGNLIEEPLFTLAAVSEKSTSTVNSLYTMSTGIDVEFEDATNETILYLDEANRRVGVGTASPDFDFHIKGNGNVIVFEGFGDTTTSPGIFSRKGAGTKASPAGVPSGSQLGGFFAAGMTDDLVFAGNSIAFLGFADETFTSTNRGAYATIATTPIGSTTRAEVMRWDHNGNVGIGTTNPTKLFHVLGGDIRLEDGNLIIDQASGGTTQPIKINADGATFIAGFFLDQQGTRGRGLLVNTVSTDSTDYLFNLRSSNTTRFIVFPDGTTGIGVTSPTAGTLTTNKRFILSIVTTLANNSTPPVSAGNLFKTGGTTAITDFDNGIVGQTIQILAENTITITDGTPIQLDGGGNFAMVSGNTLTLTMFNDQIWHEIART